MKKNREYRRPSVSLVLHAATTNILHSIHVVEGRRLEERLGLRVVHMLERLAVEAKGAES